VIEDGAPMFPRPTFFEGARLNFAENLLYPSAKVDANAPAIIAATETDREIITWAELRERVKSLQKAMLKSGIQPGDRVAGYVANHTHALIAMLAATACGAIWTAVSTDTGVHAVLERLIQISPTILFADNAAAYNGKVHPVLPKVEEIVSKLPSLHSLVILPTIRNVEIDVSKLSLFSGKAYGYEAFLELGSGSTFEKFLQLPPDHPVYILYSSGTTGAPKCIVHGSAGTLIQHKKEHLLHCSVTPKSKMLYFTTVSWM
jgi:acetoacetyl-CoA synthetase